MLVSPSLLAANFLNLENEIKRLNDAKPDYLHLDVMDGNFVPNISFGPSIIKSIKPLTNIPFDVHLMITNPDKYLNVFKEAGADIITYHFETLLNHFEMIKNIHSLGVKAGISIKPLTKIEELIPYLEELDLVLVMSVEPGFGGQKFMADMMPKVKQIRQLLDQVNPSCHLEVDGGVDMTNYQLCKDCGSDVLVAGSAYFKAEDKPFFVQELEK